MTVNESITDWARWTRDTFLHKGGWNVPQRWMHVDMERLMSMMMQIRPRTLARSIAQADVIIDSRIKTVPAYFWHELMFARDIPVLRLKTGDALEEAMAPVVAAIVEEMESIELPESIELRESSMSPFSAWWRSSSLRGN